MKFSKLFMSLAMVLTMSTTALAGIITTQPEGELKTYDRSGYAWYTVNGSVRKGAQTGTIDIVFGRDNQVYLKDPVSKYAVGTWVEGTLSEDGKTITLPLGQALYYDTEASDSVLLKVIEYDDEYEEFSINTRVKQVTYTVNGEKISLNATSQYQSLGVAYKTSGSWAGFGDYSSAYTPAEENVLVTPPTGLETQAYTFKGDEYGASNVSYTVQVGRSGNDLYIQGLFGDMPEAWVKGAIAGDSVVFESGQYLGKVNTTEHYMVATKLTDTHTIKPFVLHFDATTGDLADEYTNSDLYLILNTTRSTVYLLTAYSNVVITRVTGEPGVYEVPYEQPFSSKSALNDYTIIDANEDGVTWTYNSMSGYMAYNFSTTKAGDDWLITPKIHLLADSNYTFEMQARSFTSTMPERFEVRMGTEPTAAAMTTSVIAATEVATGDFTTFQGDVFIKTEGNYNFGVHAISDADNMMLYLDNIKIYISENTGVEELVYDSAKVNTNVYTIDGRMVRANATTLNGLPAGLYIMGGKKYIVR